MAIGKGREVRQLIVIALKDVIIYLSIELFEGIREAFVMTARIGSYRARFRRKE
jgi:hypothetical protein